MAVFWVEIVLWEFLRGSFMGGSLMGGVSWVGIFLMYFPRTKHNFLQRNFWLEKFFFFVDFLTQSFTFIDPWIILLITRKGFSIITWLKLLAATDIIFNINTGGKTFKSKGLFESDLRYLSYFKCFIGLPWALLLSLQSSLDSSHKGNSHKLTGHFISE